MDTLDRSQDVEKGGPPLPGERGTVNPKELELLW